MLNLHAIKNEAILIPLLEYEVLYYLKSYPSWFTQVVGVSHLSQSFAWLFITYYRNIFGVIPDFLVVSLIFLES